MAESEQGPMTPTTLHGTGCPECRHGTLRALPDRGGIDCGIECDNCDRWWTAPGAHREAAPARSARIRVEVSTTTGGNGFAPLREITREISIPRTYRKRGADVEYRCNGTEIVRRSSGGPAVGWLIIREL